MSESRKVGGKEILVATLILGFVVLFMFNWDYGFSATFRGYLLLFVFLGSWIGFAIYAKTIKLSLIISIGGGFIVAIIASLCAGFLFQNWESKPKEASNNSVPAKPVISNNDDSYFARAIIKESLRSPSSFTEIRSETIWSGTDNKDRPARIVRVEYDAQNGFGALIRDCRYVAFSYQDAKNAAWNGVFGIQGCDIEGTSLGRSGAISVMRNMNWDVAE